MLLGAFNQKKALVGAISVIVQPVVEPMDRFTALILTQHKDPEPESGYDGSATAEPVPQISVQEQFVEVFPVCQEESPTG